MGSKCTKPANTDRNNKSRIKIQYIISHWIRDYHLGTTFPTNLISLITDLFIYQPIFDSEQSQDDKDFALPTINILLTGDRNVGKTTLIEQYMNVMDEGEIIGFKHYNYLYKTLNIDGFEIKVEIRDMTGYGRRTWQWYHYVHGVMIVYDVNNLETFNHIRDWNEQCESNICEDFGHVERMIIANKSDLKTSTNCTKEITDLCKELNVKYCIEVSAKTGKNVDCAFSLMIQQIVCAHINPKIRIKKPFYG
eukprot:266624_1